jgi:hypothetical protein
MSLRQLSTRIELSFWQIVISLLSESQALQRLIRWAYLDLHPTLVTFLQHFEKQRAIRWAAAGLGLGLLTGILISIF